MLFLLLFVLLFNSCSEVSDTSIDPSRVQSFRSSEPSIEGNWKIRLFEVEGKERPLVGCIGGMSLSINKSKIYLLGPKIDTCPEVMFSSSYVRQGNKIISTSDEAEPEVVVLNIYKLTKDYWEYTGVGKIDRDKPEKYPFRFIWVR